MRFAIFLTVLSLALASGALFLNESLSELAEQQDELRQRLEESLERFKRAAVEQDFRATTSEAEELIWSGVDAL